MTKVDYEKSELYKLRHTASHVLAMAARAWDPKVKFAIGPPIENGFYYDFEFSKAITDETILTLEDKMAEIIKKDMPIEHKIIPFKQALNEAKKAGQDYKAELMEDIAEPELGFYGIIANARNADSNNIWSASGDFWDLCKGPHVKSTAEIKAFKLTHTAGAYWRGDEHRTMLTRIYGTAFETKKDLDTYLNQLDEAKKRDHKKLGKELGLFMFHETAPGMPYWLPKGVTLLNELIQFWRREHESRGYLEIKSPLINKKELYTISGHWEHYRENMFISETDDGEIYGVKPMNCPNAMIVFGSTLRSYRELPLRLSDTDTLHRFERSGTLNGLLRVREFSQDDAHIFITEDQIKSENKNIFEIAEKFYSIFDLKYSYRLGTRPEKFMGDLETWNTAEKALREILQKSGRPFTELEGDGAFYGPKIDIIMEDALGRSWQTGTIQLDFQLPKRFNLQYVSQDGSLKTPVVIHRVIYGSLERFIGILLEHTGGEFPIWLAPIQVKVIPVSEKFDDYARKVTNELRIGGVRVEIDESSETLGKRIRNAELEKIPNIIIVGEKESQAENITLRVRHTAKQSTLTVAQFISSLK